MSFIRKLELLRLVPRSPNSATAEELLREIRDERGFDISLRTLQRDLRELELLFEICSEGNPPRWRKMGSAAKDGLPVHDTYSALTFCLVEDYLKLALPHNVTNRLEPIFIKARQLLGEHPNGFDARRWYQNVRILSRGMPLTPPEIREDVFRAVCEALWHGEELASEYQNRHDPEPRKLALHPHALVLRDGVLYLLATINSYTDIRHLALHRMHSAESTGAEASRQPGFDLGEYIRQGHFSYIEGEPIELVVRFDPYVARHLLECPMSDDQRDQELADGRIEIRATVHDSQQLVWWLLGFGDAVEVMAPSTLRARIREQVESLFQRYR